MRRKLVKIFNVLMITVLSLIIVLGIGSALFVGVSYFMAEVSPLGYAYLLIGELIMPIETLVNKGVGKFPEETIKIVIIATGLIVSIISIICIKLFSKATKNKKGIKLKTLITSLIFQLALGTYFAFNGICTYLNMNSYNKYINKKVVDGVVKNILQSLGDGFVTIKGLVVCASVVVLSALLFITYLLNIERKPKGLKIISNINFYSEDYFKNVKAKSEGTKKEQTDIKQVNIMKPKPKKQSQELINRIMQLNELRDTNQISDVEYTKLRTKAIRRYKG